MNNTDWDEAIDREAIMAKEECKKEIEYYERIRKAVSKGIKRERAIQMHKEMFGWVVYNGVYVMDSKE